MNGFMPPKPMFEFNVDLARRNRIICEVDFDSWFDREVKPLFENAVEVYKGPDWVSWHEAPGPDSNATQKALLINIQEIKLETADDILREFVDGWENKAVGTGQAYRKALKYLESK